MLVGQRTTYRRNGLPGVVEEGFQDDVRLLTEEDHMAAMMEKEALAVGQVVMDHG